MNDRMDRSGKRRADGILAVFALMVALVLGAPACFAQNPYGVGGYLERPYLSEDDGGTASQDGAAVDAARRQRRPRPAGSQEQPQTSQPGVNSPALSVPQKTGAAQGGPQRRSPESAQKSAQSGNLAQPRRTTGQGDPPSAQQRNRPSAVEAKPERTQQPSAGDEAGKRDVSDLAIPPVPLRRPQFADAPARIATLAEAEPASAEEESREAGIGSAEQTPTDEAVTPPPQEANAVEAPAASPASEATAPTMAAVTEPSETPRGGPAQPVSTAPASDIAAMAENNPTSEPAPSDPSPAPQARITADAPAESPAPASPLPQSQVATLTEPRTPPAASETAANLPSSMMAAATEVDPATAEIAPFGTMANLKAIETAPQQPEAERSSVQQDAAASSAAPLQPQAEGMAATAPTEAPAPVAQEPQALPVATSPPAQADIPVIDPPMPIRALSVRQTRVAAGGEAIPSVPQPPIRQTASLEKIIGQMLVVGFRGLTPEESWPQKLAAQIKAGTIGGVLFMSHNVQSPQQVKTLTGFLQKTKTEIPVLFAVDQEGGIVQRLSAEKGFQEYPTAGKIGQSNDPLTAYSVYRRLAAELSQNGFNLNLGPVVDLLRNTASPIIAGKERSFGTQPKHVTAFAKAFCIAHQDEGVLTVLKHFPGHGSTPFDTHVQPVDVGQSWKEDEMAPYRELIASRTAQAVMMGHIANPAMSDEPGMPASLSGKAIRQVLRGDLGFTGIVISDDLEMGAIRARYSIEDSAVKAIKAGNDIVILSNQNAPAPDLPERVAAAIRKAVDTGELRREELQASYDRILNFKQRLPSGAAATNVGSGAAAGNKRASAERGKSASAR